MRDINRLDNFYDELKQIHRIYPDWRFGQMVVNFQRWCIVVKNIHDIFYLEDDECLTLLKEYIADIQNEWG